MEKKGHFTLHDTNSMTNAIPQTMMPELKLFMATNPAMGRVRATTYPIFFHLLIFMPMVVITAARSTIRAILTNSVGWKLKGPTPSQRFLPLTSRPTRLTAIISMYDMR